MAKGIPLMGRDPDGEAKIINVDENGNVKVQQSGTIVVKGIGKNLFNSATATAGYVVRDTGLTSVANNWYHSDFTEVEAGSYIVFNKLNSSASGGLAFYDTDGELVVWHSNDDLIANNNVVFVPPTAKTFRASNNVGSATIFEWQIEYGTIITDFEPYREVDYVRGLYEQTKERYLDLRGLSGLVKPIGLPKFSTYMEMDTQIVYYFDGTDWQVME